MVGVCIGILELEDALPRAILCDGRSMAQFVC